MEDRLLGIAIVAAANTLRRETFQIGIGEPLAEDGPTSTQQWFLSYIWQNADKRDVFQKDIEEAFRVRRSTATEILKAMERKRLIIRIPTAEDRRKKKILLTDKARGICLENQQKIMATERRLVKGLSAREINDFLNILDKIQSNISD